MSCRRGRTRHKADARLRMSRKPSSTPSTMADIARLAGVSSSTVSRALAGSPLVAKKKRDLIARLAREQGYVVNTTARNLRLRRTQCIAVVLPAGSIGETCLADPVILALLGHLADELGQRGYSILLQKIQGASDDWVQRLDVGNRPDGVIVIGPQDGAAEPAARARLLANEAMQRLRG